MSFSKQWDKIYQNREQLNRWPWSDLISILISYADLRNKKACLELGSGAGGNIPFFLENQINYFGIEGSNEAVNEIVYRFPNLKNNIIVGDFSKSIAFDFKFDLIFDRASITHNTLSSIINTIDLIKSKLNKNGLFAGIDWFSNKHTDFEKGEKVDNYTKNNFKSGQFKNIGNVFFSDEEILKELFKDFEFIYFQHKKIDIKKETLATYSFVVKKIV
ncbi:class I SAM-dependent methyltransferase [Flavobacteriaceae bacterium]|nr:class I SAM-dependent methyltransferase [Flavobacteriaceae bacterium]